MKYILFIGKRYGYILLKLLVQKKANILFVFIEREHLHESEKYTDDIIALCKSVDISFTTNLNKNHQLACLDKNTADFILVYGYRRMIAKEVYTQAKYGALALHYALLPKYRGFAPVNWSIINGETETGVTLFFLTEEVDAGDIVDQRRISILFADDISTVMEKCDTAALSIWNTQLDNFENKLILRSVQNHDLASYTCSRTPEDGRINWAESTMNIYNKIRALTLPYPCAFTMLDGKKACLIDAEIYDAGNYVGRIPGAVVKIIKNAGVVVLTGDGALLIKNILVEPEGKVTADSICKSIRTKFLS